MLYSFLKENYYIRNSCSYHSFGPKIIMSVTGLFWENTNRVFFSSNRINISFNYLLHDSTVHPGSNGSCMLGCINASEVSKLGKQIFLQLLNLKYDIHCCILDARKMLIQCSKFREESPWSTPPPRGGERKWASSAWRGVSGDREHPSNPCMELREKGLH